MANAYFYSNIAVATTLSGNINNAVTTCTVAATTGWPGSFPFVIAIDYGGASEELVKVTANASNTLTIVRAFGGTSAVSHSTGAVVRHVANAQDLTDFRTHEAATSDVHGVTGALVGATQSQTLTNKTLTAPTITNPTMTGGGSLAGTYSGTPTWSGLATFSGGAAFSGAVTHTNDLTVTRGAAGTPALQTLVTADTFDRFRVYADGKLEWGPGNAARDVTLYRGAVDVLETLDTFRVYGGATTTDAIQTRVTGDTVSRLNIDADGTHSWGPGGAGAQDTNLYRNGVGILKTDGDLQVGGNVSAANVSSGAWSTWAVSWTAENGTNPTLGNGTLVGRYYKINRLVTFNIQLVWGSTSVPGNGGGTENWLFSLPFQVAAAWDALRIVNALGRDVSSGNQWGGTAVVSTGGSGRVSTTQANDHALTAIWDSSAPFSVDTGDIYTWWGTYESTT